MGRNLPLRTRRLLARGIGPRNGRRWAGAPFLSLGSGNRASLTTALTGTNNDFVVTAKTPGTAGNSRTLTIAVAGNNTPLSVAVDGNAITVNSATNGSAEATSTAAQVVRAINESATAGPIVWASVKPGDDGTGVVTALAATSLAGAV